MVPFVLLPITHVCYFHKLSFDAGLRLLIRLVIRPESVLFNFYGFFSARLHVGNYRNTKKKLRILEILFHDISTNNNPHFAYANKLQ